MPYTRSGKCVYKKNTDGSRGEKVGCSDSEEEAKQYMKRLYSLDETDDELLDEDVIDRFGGTSVNLLRQYIRELLSEQHSAAMKRAVKSKSTQPMAQIILNHVHSLQESKASDAFESTIANSINASGDNITATRPTVGTQYSDVRVEVSGMGSAWVEVKMNKSDNLSNPRMFYNGASWDTTYKTPAAKYAVDLLNASSEAASFISDISIFSKIKNPSIPTTLGGLRNPNSVPLEVMREFVESRGTRYIAIEKDVDIGSLVTQHYIVGKAEPADYMQSGDSFYLIGTRDPFGLASLNNGSIPVLGGTGDFKIRVSTRSKFYEIQAEIKIKNFTPSSSGFSALQGTSKINPFLKLGIR
ncbi:MAG TPA: hypothetical protein EYG51_16890 [Pseudomonadales bacterium]|nr:hypothetical protein [Pseudomonadales bacterium]